MGVVEVAEQQADRDCLDIEFGHFGDEPVDLVVRQRDQYLTRCW